MKKVLIGIIMDGKAGGVDGYILKFYNAVSSEDVRIDFLTYKADPTLKAMLKEKGSELIETPSFKKPFAATKSMKNIVKNGGYDTVYLNASTTLVCFSAKGAKKGGAKKIAIHAHSSSFHDKSRLKTSLIKHLNNLFKPMLCRNATDLYSCSDTASEWMFTRKAIAEKRVIKIDNAVDTEKFSFNSEKRREIRERFGLSDCFVAGHIGNFLYPKNHSFLIDVFAELSKKDDSARLMLIGDGELFEEIKAKAEKKGIIDKIVFTGKVSDTSEYLNAMDIFLLPSLFEGLPFAAVEAQINKLPSLLSDRISREAKMGDLCEFLEIDSPEIWAEKILSWKALGRESLKITNTDFCFDKDEIVKQLKQII